MTDHSPAPAAQDENRLIAERRAKLSRLREAGVAYPNDFVPDAHAADLHRQYGEQDQEALAAAGAQVKVAGRLMLKPVIGQASVATVQDSTGRIPLYLHHGHQGDRAQARLNQRATGT